MRPQPCSLWNRNSEMDSSYRVFPSFQPLPGKFNFRDLSMNQQRPAASHDYFSAKPIRGSSPTSSLTADLDANFHIDKRSVLVYWSQGSAYVPRSPQFVTPRRSLFTTSIQETIGLDGKSRFAHSNCPVPALNFSLQQVLTEWKVRVSTPPIEHASTSTPMVPSSSPGVDMMDVSPLPHKPAFFIAQVSLPSPTPEETPQESMPSAELLHPLYPAAAQPSSHLQLPE